MTLKPYPRKCCPKCAVEAGGVRDTTQPMDLEPGKCEVCRFIRAVASPGCYGNPSFRGHSPSQPIILMAVEP